MVSVTQTPIATINFYFEIQLNSIYARKRRSLMAIHFEIKGKETLGPLFTLTELELFKDTLPSCGEKGQRLNSLHNNLMNKEYNC